jgi:hypothetical protein
MTANKTTMQCLQCRRLKSLYCCVINSLGIVHLTFSNTLSLVAEKKDLNDRNWGLYTVKWHHADPSSHMIQGMGLQPPACWDCEFKSHKGHGCLSLVSVVCFQEEISASGWSLIQSSPTECSHMIQGVGLQSLACWDCEFESHKGHGCLSLVSIACFQVQVSASGWSLIQSSPTERSHMIHGVGLQPLACWDCEFESHKGHGCLSLVSVVCFHVEASALGWSLIQSSPTECGVSNECDCEASKGEAKTLNRIEVPQKKKWYSD